MAVVNIKTVVPEGATAMVVIDLKEAEDLFFEDRFQPVRNLFPFNALSEHLINTDDPEEIINELVDIVTGEPEEEQPDALDIQFVQVKDMLKDLHTKLEHIFSNAIGETQHEFDNREAQVRDYTAKIFLS